jgi:hypothetical protein
VIDPTGIVRLGSERSGFYAGGMNSTGSMDNAPADPTDSSKEVMACPVPRPVLPAAELTAELQAMVDKGVDPLWLRTLGHAPEVLIAWTQYYWPLLFGGAVDTKIKEAARLRIARLNGCHY